MASLTELQKIDEVCEAISAAVGQRLRWKGTVSQYARLVVGDVAEISVRVSDHGQKGEFGGYSNSLGYRHSAADVCFLVSDESEIPSREEIRRVLAPAVLKAWREWKAI